MILSTEGYGLLSLLEFDSSLLSTFNSSKKDLNQFLLNESITYQNSRIGNTTCVFHQDCPDRIIAYFTLSNSGIKVTANEFLELGINTSTKLQVIPAVLIGRFALDNEYADCGNGRNILNLTMSSIVQDFKVSATRLVVVDSGNDVEEFYLKCGFIKSYEAEKKAKNHASNTVKMYKDILATCLVP